MVSGVCNLLPYGSGRLYALYTFLFFLFFILFLSMVVAFSLI